MESTGLLVSLEGISGVGKTYFARKLIAALDESTTRFVNELSDRSGNGLDKQIIDALRHSGDRFFRSGMPLSETFLLLALKMADYEKHIAHALQSGFTVVEDRSIDTVAVYQSILLRTNSLGERLDLSNKIYMMAAQWRHPPDVTFLIEDEFDVCITRAEARQGAGFAEDELELLRDAADLYAHYAEMHTPRVVRLDRRIMDEENIIRRVCAEILSRRQLT
jgi:dTMP kinase